MQTKIIRQPLSFARAGLVLRSRTLLAPTPLTRSPLVAFAPLSLRTLSTKPPSRGVVPDDHRPKVDSTTPLLPLLRKSRLTRALSLHIPSLAFSERNPFTSLVIRLVLSSVLGLTVLVGAIFLHDAFTYSERHIDRVPANALSLHPRLGGKKNLPVLEVNLDSEEDDEKRAMKGKPRLVIVGGGWGVSLAFSLDLSRMFRFLPTHLRSLGPRLST
jgi:hypothetical protein